MKHMKHGVVLLALLLAAMTMVPVVSARNETTDWVHSFDKWVEPQDMSKYNKVFKPVHVTKMNETTVLLYPGAALLKSGTKFTSIPSYVDSSKSSMSTASVKILNKKSRVTDSIPSVVMTEGEITWYWTQDTWISNEITIYNEGSSTASGKVFFWSYEDEYAYYVKYINLLPGTSQVITVPFQVIGSLSSVGKKPIAVQITVDPDDTTTWAYLMPIDAIEKFNNDASHLPDPNQGENLETSDLYHFPFSEGYPIINEAATAADNSVTPYDAGFLLMNHVYGVMTYDLVNPDTLYAASDLWITDHAYHGVCDEYATLDVSFSRALGIPTRFLGLTFVNESGTSFGHGILEMWDYDHWVHADPTWHSFDNPQIYKNGNNTHMDLIWNNDADDMFFTEDPTGDGLLRYEDFRVRQHLGELPEYN